MLKLQVFEVANLLSKKQKSICESGCQSEQKNKLLVHNYQNMTADPGAMNHSMTPSKSLKKIYLKPKSKELGEIMKQNKLQIVKKQSPHMNRLLCT